MATASPLMAGKRGIVMGVANARSLAWGVAKSLADHGADLAFTFQGEAIEKRLRPLAESVGSDFVLPCDVTDDASVDATFEAIAARWGSLDFLVHAIAYSDKEELKGRYLDTTLENFQTTLQVSCYSFTALCQRAVPLMAEGGGGLLTLTYMGAERWGAALQRDGRGQGGAGSERALSRRRPRRSQHPGQRDFCGTLSRR